MAAVFHFSHLDPALFRIDFEHLVQNAHLDILLAEECLRCSGNQFIQVVDNTADIVRDSSSGVGCIRPAFESQDFKIGIPPPCLGCRTHAGGIPPDDDQTLFAHWLYLFSNEVGIGY